MAIHKIKFCELPFFISENKRDLIQSKMFVLLNILVIQPYKSLQ